MQPTPVFLPGKSHGCWSLVGCSPWGLEESDVTERIHFHFSLSCIGEGNGDPLQCSCLENPRDGGAWWAAVYGVAQSRTRLKRLSSSSILCHCLRALFLYTCLPTSYSVSKVLLSEITLIYFTLQCVCAQLLSGVWLFGNPWTVACQVLSRELPRQEHWSGLPFPTPGDLPDLGIEPESPALAGRFFTNWATWEALYNSVSEKSMTLNIKF